MKGAVGLLGCALAGTLVLACSREDDKPKQIDLAPGFAHLPSAAAEGGVRAASAPRRDDLWPGDRDASTAPRPFQVMVTRTIVRDGGATPPPAVNPDDAVLERARIAAGGCFASLSVNGAPERSAHIAFTVIPTGTVSRVDVSSGDTTDEGVLSCIRQQALATAFSDNAGGPLRNYAIDVQVFAKGNGGGR